MLQLVLAHTGKMIGTSIIQVCKYYKYDKKTVFYLILPAIQVILVSIHFYFHHLNQELKQ